MEHRLVTTTEQDVVLKPHYLVLERLGMWTAACLSPRDVFDLLTFKSLSQINHMDSVCRLIKVKWILTHISTRLMCYMCPVFQRLLV